MIVHYLLRALRYGLSVSGIAVAMIVGMALANGTLGLHGAMAACLAWFAILIPTLGFAFSVFAYSVFRKNEYAMYYNLGISRLRLHILVLIADCAASLVLSVILNLAVGHV